MFDETIKNPRKIGRQGTALEFAAQNGKLACLKELLAAGAPVMQINWTSFDRYYKHSSCLKALLDAFLDHNIGHEKVCSLFDEEVLDSLPTDKDGKKLATTITMLSRHGLKEKHMYDYLFETAQFTNFSVTKGDSRAIIIINDLLATGLDINAQRKGTQNKEQESNTMLHYAANSKPSFVSFF